MSSKGSQATGVTNNINNGPVVFKSQSPCTVSEFKRINNACAQKSGNAILDTAALDIAAFSKNGTVTMWIL